MQENDAKFLDLVVKAKDIDETWIELLATIFQHEIDHGKGILISDIGKEIHIW